MVFGTKSLFLRKNSEISLTVFKSFAPVAFMLYCQLSSTKSPKSLVNSTCSSVETKNSKDIFNTTPQHIRLKLSVSLPNFLVLLTNGHGKKQKVQELEYLPEPKSL